MSPCTAGFDDAATGQDGACNLAWTERYQARLEEDPIVEVELE